MSRRRIPDDPSWICTGAGIQEHVFPPTAKEGQRCWCGKAQFRRRFFFTYKEWHDPARFDHREEEARIAELEAIKDDSIEEALWFLSDVFKARGIDNGRKKAILKNWKSFSCSWNKKHA